MATIKIAEDLNVRDDAAPSRHNTYEGASSSAAAFGDPILNIRTRRSSVSLSRRDDTEAGAADEDPGLAREGDYKDKQVFRGKMLFWLAYQSLGVIYGDIGTSPLYVYSSTFKEAPSKQDLVGVLSLIIWSLFMMVTVKYVFIVLRADNGGEGGTFSTYALLGRYMNITHRDPREATFVKMQRIMSTDLASAGRKMRKGVESSRLARNLLKVMGVFAVSMVLSDGVLTPAQSVLGAVQGVQVVNPNISKGAIIGITDAILVLLFAVQPLGITKMTFAFAPIVMIWLAFNAVFGIYNLVKFDASVFIAFNPALAFEYLGRHGEEGWKALGGVLLAFTGVEALFADLGAFSMRAIQMSWLTYTLPCLLLAYVGQAAYISVHPEAYSNPFFNAAPPGTVWPALIIAILAAIVASQAIITATFQLLAQAMKLSYFPQLKVVHTSDIFHGQLYIPLINWLLMIGTILIASIYNNTTSLGNAYGVCVIFVTFFDTIMVSMTAIFVWRLNPYIVFFPFLIIALMDGTFLSSVLTKVPSGAWFTLALATFLGSGFLLWRYGKEQQWAVEAEDRFPTSYLLRSSQASDSDSLYFSPKFGEAKIERVDGFGVFFDKAGETTPTVFSQFALKLAALPSVIVFFHLRPLEVPSVPSEERFTISRLSIKNCYRIVVRYGYNDSVIGQDLGSILHAQLKRYIIGDVGSEAPTGTSTATELSRSTTTDEKERSESQEDDDRKSPMSRRPSIPVEEEVAELDRAFATREIFIIGKEQMKIKKENPIVRKVLLNIFLWIRDNTRTKIASLNVPREKVIEVGFLKEI